MMGEQELDIDMALAFGMLWMLVVFVYCGREAAI